jgi:hypothetical protein
MIEGVWSSTSVGGELESHRSQLQGCRLHRTYPENQGRITTSRKTKGASNWERCVPVHDLVCVERLKDRAGLAWLRFV